MPRHGGIDVGDAAMKTRRAAGRPFAARVAARTPSRAVGDFGLGRQCRLIGFGRVVEMPFNSRAPDRGSSARRERIAPGASEFDEGFVSLPLPAEHQGRDCCDCEHAGGESARPLFQTLFGIGPAALKVIDCSRDRNGFPGSWGRV